MSLLTKLLDLLRPGQSPASGGAPPAPPELTSLSEEGLCDLVLSVDGYELLPMGSQVLHATGLHRGRRVALEVVLGPEWREGKVAGQPSWTGIVTWRSVGAESDALLRIMDELYGTKGAPVAMARATDFACISLGGDPRDLRRGPLQAKLFYEVEAEDGEGCAELYANVDLAAKRLELREKDPEYRGAIVAALTAAPPPAR